MEVTDIRIKRVEEEGKLKAWVSATFDDCFVVHNMKIIEGQQGKFLAMPSRVTRTGEHKDIAHPISSEFREALQEKIIGAYEQMK